MAHYLVSSERKLLVVGRGNGDYVIVEDCRTGNTWAIPTKNLKEYIRDEIYKLFYTDYLTGEISEVPFAKSLNLEKYDW